jgi:hypothetical protein
MGAMDGELTRGGPSAIDVFAGSTYTLVRPLFSWRRTYRVYDVLGRLIASVEQPWFRFRTELILYGPPGDRDPILVIKNRRFAAVNMEHDIFDARSLRRLGVIRTRGMRSLLRDAWDILDAEDRPVGQMLEEGNFFLRRIIRFLPGRHVIELGGREVARIMQIFHLFRREFALEILEVDDPIEPRFAIACALVAVMADLRREDNR